VVAQSSLSPKTHQTVAARADKDNGDCVGIRILSKRPRLTTATYGRSDHVAVREITALLRMTLSRDHEIDHDLRSTTIMCHFWPQAW
jgi:hypothetical protein